MDLLRAYINKYRLAFTIACLNSITNKVLDLMPPILVGWLVDSLGTNIPSLLQNTGVVSVKGAVITIIVLTVIIFSLESLFEWLFSRSFKRIAQKVQHDIRTDLYRKMQKLPQSYYENNRLGNILSILNDDVNQLERFINTGFNDLLQMVVLFIFAAITLSVMSWELMLIGMAPIPFIIFGSILYQKWISPRYKRMRNTIGILNSRLENNISGMQVVKMFNAESFENERVEKVSNEYKEGNFRIIDLNAAYIPVIRTFITAGFAIGLLVAAFWVIEGSGKMSLGGIALYGMLIQRLLWPVTRLGQIFDDYERAQASIQRIKGVFETPEEHSKNKEPLNTNFDHILFENIGFSYIPESPVLKDINIRIKKGESIGIVGPTGAGKTTLIKLLSRLYEPTVGSIKLDDQELGNVGLTEWRSQISIVNQEVYLFDGSIRENIAYGIPAIDDSEIVKAAKMSYGAKLSPLKGDSSLKPLLENQ